MKLTPAQRKNLIPLVLLLANVVYLYIGGLVFKSIEYKPQTKYTTAEEVSNFLQTLKGTSVGQKILPKDFDSKAVAKELSSESLKNFDKEFEKIRTERTAAAKPGWSFSNSLFFATTVVTTIGYGNLAPVTLGGRMFCVVYALIGIPLTLMLLAVVGNKMVQCLNDACAWLVNRIRRYHTGYQYEESGAQINAPVWIALPIIFFFLAAMSSMYCALEGWDFGTALYFIFITFTTIGFGDVVPRTQALTLIFQGIWINLMLLYVGLSVVSITINLCAQSLMTQLKKTGLYLKLLQLFSSQAGDSGENSTTPAQEKESASKQDRRPRRERNEDQKFEMEKMESRPEREQLDTEQEDDNSATKLKIVQDANGKYYGTLQE